MADMPTTFFRLLPIPIDAKGDVLAERIAALNAAGRAEDVFTLDPAAFAQIPGSPFAYWVGDSMFSVFRTFGPLEKEGRTAKRGPSSGDDFRRIRAWWEVASSAIGRNTRWVSFAKGGAYSLYYCDVHLVVDWDEDRFTFRDFYGRPGREIPKLESCMFFFRPGLTYISRPMLGFCARVLPAGCVFAHVSPGIFVPDNSDSLTLLAILNAKVTDILLSLSLSRGSETSGQTKAFEVGQVQRVPLPTQSPRVADLLQRLASEAHDLQRDRDRTDETTHAFGLPGLVQQRSAPSLDATSQALDAAEQARLARLAAIQAEIDEIVLKLYGLTISDFRLTIAESGEAIDNRQSEIVNEDDEDEEPAIADTLPRRAADLLQWCVGAAFGRWDVRMALDPSLLPALAGPFDPLPRCAPGALAGVDGLPPATVDAIAPEVWLRARQTVLDLPAIDNSQLPIDNCQFPLPFPEDGILVDDPTHPSDIVARVRQVLRLLWGERADAVEQEACEALGVRDLRAWFRDPRQGFFAYHIKRYSKSRRKAPIYWLLQSEKRNYAIWLYCHRLHKHSLYVAGRDYADAKVRLEETRLAELRGGLDTAAAAYSTGGSSTGGSATGGSSTGGSLTGAARRQAEREIDRQEKLVAEVTAFRNTLDQIALRNLLPDLNDGVIISVAPLHPLMPWKEAERMWDALVKGQYGWSSMAQEMRKKGLVD